MPNNPKDRDHAHVEDIDPAPMLGRVGDGATQQSGEYISRELRELTERARAHRHEGENKKDPDEN